MDNINNADLSELTEQIEPENQEDQNNQPEQSLPTSEQIEKELSRISQNSKKSNPIKTLIQVLIVSAAVVVLITSLLTPVIKVSGNAMQPTLNNDDVSIAIKTTKLEKGDVCCFYNNNNLFVRRVIGTPGDVIEISEDGTVLVNSETLNEAYITEKALGDCDMTFPFTVPENNYFVLGDNRPVSKDSRINEIGCVSFDRIVGKLIVTVWPVYAIGIVD
ncbi:MAG: signal peptidase I [Oscillospiraceae bacterium]|nr:signal peptidase I [Oscillospiraceae bacterium]